ncbi:MAG: hypothetical protein ACLUJG_08875 [Lawsonibacter sp.]
MDGTTAGIMLVNQIAKHKCPLSNELLQIKSILSLYSSKRAGRFKNLWQRQRDRSTITKRNKKTYPAELAVCLSSSYTGMKGKDRENAFPDRAGLYAARKIEEFYLFTDTSCNYAFYEHQGMKRRSEKHIFTVKDSRRK